LDDARYTQAANLGAVFQSLPFEPVEEVFPTDPCGKSGNVVAGRYPTGTRVAVLQDHTTPTEPPEINTRRQAPRAPADNNDILDTFLLHHRSNASNIQIRHSEQQGPSSSHRLLIGSMILFFLMMCPNVHDIFVGQQRIHGR
jgi:hypothetical protein